MIDFSKYLEQPIVLVTNFVDTPDKLFGIRSKYYGIELFTYKGKYVCVRKLTTDDLKDEDYLQWLNAMWPNEEKLNKFIKNRIIFEESIIS